MRADTSSSCFLLFSLPILSSSSCTCWISRWPSSQLLLSNPEVPSISVKMRSQLALGHVSKGLTVDCDQRSRVELKMRWDGKSLFGAVLKKPEVLRGYHVEKSIQTRTAHVSLPH